MRAPSVVLTALLASPALLAAPRPGPSTPAAPHEITIDWIFSDEAEVLTRPTHAVWTSDGTVLLLDERKVGAERTFERVDPLSRSRSAALDAGAALSSLRSERAGKGAPDSLGWPESLDRAGRLAAYVFDGDVFLLRFADSTFERLTRTETEESVPRLSPDGHGVAFVRDNDLWLLDVSNRSETRLTRDGSGTIRNGRLSWLYWEEIFDHVEDGILWSPDSSALAFLRTDESPVAVSTFVDIEPATPRLIEQRYPTAGGANPLVRLGIYDLASGRTSWLDPSTVPYEYLLRMEWLDDSQALGVETLDRAQDRADLYRVDRGGAARRVLTGTDPAWVNLIDFHFLADGSGLVATSQDDGYNHLYRYGPDGERRQALTRGEWSVRGPGNWQASTIATTVDEAHGLAYFTARRPDLTQIQLYRVGLDGSGLERISSERGVHAVRWSDDRRFYLDWHSSHDRPTSLSVHDASGAERAVLSEVPGRELAALDVQTPELFTVPAADGHPLQARLYKPADFDPGHPYPLIVYVYGEPNAPAVMDGWRAWPPPGSAFYEQVLLREGYLVATIDSRVATAETKAMENLIFEKVSGPIEVADLVAGVRWFKSQPWVDAARVGIWGWSGGGTTTLLMMTRSEEFKAGIAVAPVADRRTYDTKYTEAYMRTPEENRDGYEDVSLVPRAKDLHGRLLLVHGSADDNVHPQNSYLFANQLVEAEIPFDMMIYPMRKHDIADRAARRHLYSLMVEFWKRWL
jgi:dipeptidyl-peptidase-4